MSNQTKLRSTQPNNNLKGAMEGVPQSRVYQEKSNQGVPMETLSYTNDVFIGLGVVNKGDTSVFRIPNHLRLIKQVILMVQVRYPSPLTGAEQQRIACTDYKLHNMVDTFSYRFAGAERMDIRPWSAITEILDGLETDEQREQYRILNGKAYHPLQNGDWLYMILPLPCSDSSSLIHNRSYPFPLHLTSEPMEVNIKWGDLFEVSAAKVQIKYGDLAYAEEYKNSTYRYQFKSLYGYSYPVEAPATAADVRRIDLASLRPGETTEFVFSYVPEFKENSNLFISGTSADTTLPTLWAMRDRFAFNRKQAGYGSKLKNIKLYYLNQCIWDLDDKLSGVYDLFQKKKTSKYGEHVYYPQGAACAVTDAPASVATHPSGYYSSKRINAVANNATFSAYPEQLINSTQGQQILQGVPHKIGSYFYCIPIAEILSEFSKNSYSLGVDFTHSTLQLEFTVDSEDTKQTLGSIAAGMSPGLAENLSSGTLHLTQKVQSIYQFMGSTVSLIQ